MYEGTIVSVSPIDHALFEGEELRQFAHGETLCWGRFVLRGARPTPRFSKQMGSHCEGNLPFETEPLLPFGLVPDRCGSRYAGGRFVL